MGVTTSEIQRDPSYLHKPAMACDAADHSGGSSRRLWGLLIRRSRWSLSWRAWLLFTAFGLAITYAAIVNVYPFLAVTQRVDTKTLVVEGWVHKYAIRSAINEFETGSYELLFTTGGPVVGNGGYVNDFQTAASVGARLLKEFGLPEESLRMVPSHETDRDRTYSSAIALRNWFRDHDMPVRSFNLLTEDLHARRTRLLFQEAFGRGVKVGIISVPNPDYDQRHWWRYSEGVRDVVSESVAYLYAKFLFWPASPKDETTGLQDHGTTGQ